MEIIIISIRYWKWSFNTALFFSDPWHSWRYIADANPFLTYIAGAEAYILLILYRYLDSRFTTVDFHINIVTSHQLLTAITAVIIDIAMQTGNHLPTYLLI